MPPAKQTTFGEPPIKLGRNIKKKYNTSKSKYHSLSTGATTPESIMADMESVFGKKNFYMLYSGGRDSGLVLDWMSEHGKLKAVVHVKTNVGMKMTEDFVRDHCKSNGWKLIILEPRPKFAYVSMALEHGFPGPSNHNVVMGRLKGLTMQNFFYSLKDESACFVSGIRKKESSRRGRNFLTPIQQDGNVWFVSPFYFKTNEEMYKARLLKNIPTSPAYDHGLSVSGDCFCGCYSGYEEKDALRKADPHLAEFIAWMEEGVRKFGSENAKKYPKWGRTARMSEIDQQYMLNEMLETFPQLRNVAETESQFCGDDCGPGTMKGMTDY